MSEEKRKPDIAKDRLSVIIGAVSFSQYGPELEHTSDTGRHWLTLVHEKEIPQATEGAWPRERHVPIDHELVIGTVDELVEKYRADLTRAFYIMAEPNTPVSDQLVKQNDLFKEKGIDKLTSMGSGWPQRLIERQKLRNERQKYEYSQDGYARDLLFRLVADWNQRKYGPLEGRSKWECPSESDTQGLDNLIAALTELRDDEKRRLGESK